MTSPKSKIIISIPLVWCIRNFILAGITQELAKRYEIFYAIPEIGKSYMHGIGIPSERLLILNSQKYTRLQSWCSMILHKSHRKRFPTTSDEIFKTIIEPKRRGLKSYLVAIASTVFKLPFFYSILEHVEQRLYVKRIDLELEAQVKLIHPVFAISTAYVLNTEWPLFRLLHALEIKIYTHVLSFENLTSRGYLPIRFFDRFLVWNLKMAKELQAIYAVPEHKIIITGTPRFDFHVHPDYLKSSEWTLSRLGIDSENYIVYCANHVMLTPDEPALVKQIIQTFQTNDVLKSYHLVLRLHPMDDYDRWTSLLNDFPSISISYPWPHHDKQSLVWGEPTLEEIVMFSNTLRYSSLVLTIASTISIDAAILDKPVVCVGFSSDASYSFNSLYYNFYYVDHCEPIMKMNATTLSVDCKA